MWRRRSKTDCNESDEVRRAREVAKHASAERRQVEEQWPAVKKIGGSLQKALERNHFGESIERAWALRRE
jgi:hypothetical protein